MKIINKIDELVKNNLKEDVTGKVSISEIYNLFLDCSTKKQLNCSEREFRRILIFNNFKIIRCNSIFFITGWTLKMDHKK